MRYLIDADIKQCFESFDHQQLQTLLKRRVIDGSIKRLVGKWLNAGVMDGNELIFPEHGTPQGGVISPLLANIYLHYVLDEWIEKDVRQHCQGAIGLVRYADDFVISCELKSDAERIMEVLPQRFAKYGLTIHPEKTRLVNFEKPTAEENKGKESFSFLGFRLYWAKSWRGYWVIKKATDKKRLARTKKRIGEWCKRNRHEPVKKQHKKLVAKLKGHYNYYGVIGNYERLSVVYHYALRSWQKWLDRRGAKRTLTWPRFEKLLKTFPLPRPRIMHAV
jgi:group II intron reverse transcriptase/maturase